MKVCSTMKSRIFNTAHAKISCWQKKVIYGLSWNIPHCSKYWYNSLVNNSSQLVHITVSFWLNSYAAPERQLDWLKVQDRVIALCPASLFIKPSDPATVYRNSYAVSTHRCRYAKALFFLHGNQPNSSQLHNVALCYSQWWLGLDSFWLLLSVRPFTKLRVLFLICGNV